MADPDKARVQGLSMDRFEGAEFMRQVFVARPKPGTPFESVLDPAYWAHNASKLRLRDRIEIEPEDNAYFAELRVIDCGRTWAKVLVLRHIDLNAPAEKAEEAADESFIVKFRGPKKWSVVRESDKAIMVEGLGSEAEAGAWLEQNREVVTA